ncbi:aminotransferase class III-fold pyridoxal phosphate-dependent enzyme [Xenorhabdus szentirmaii]|uniref:Aminotransferase n=1 Tax=Xenorhabdus szentirmaii DSM 16338 TaxID=1427518 RepID=W1J1D2_9GAMM|nr:MULTISPECIES: aminotransferase class III-fold pyridoxal phosphate-dependent enzyme [Xenorhabdus]MBD2822749.1 aminotransferase class III-fold pyridoxal phosphate-dependent enzyme [Xenorhabdus sp. 42]PHM34011.1 glutamate-1-semialdehyde aminotransferase [Xenorhabdus szentirmaii DSM 16338]CDL84504.1 putative aminotransferase [Xenorhabdus szentirmaii DSM 16338]
MSKPEKIASAVGVPVPNLRALSASGAVVKLSDGRDYIDLMNGKGNITLGHHHPTVTEAIVASLNNKLGSSTCWSEPFEDLAEIIVADSGISNGQVAFFSSGTEACRAVVQCARKITGKKIIASAGYHGWGDLWSSSSHFLQPNENGIIDFYFIPELLADVLENYHGEVAMVMISPDYVHLKPETLKKIASLAREYGVLFCSDEVKNGYRSVAGSALSQVIGIQADFYTFAKGLCNGQRLSCLVGSSDMMQKTKHMTYTAYFDTVPIVAALATLKYMHREQGYKRLATCGSILANTLCTLITQVELPIKVMGDGPLLQFICATPELDEAFYTACARHRLLLYKFDNQAISLATEAVLTELEIRFKQVFSELAQNFSMQHPIHVPIERQMEAAFNMIDGASDVMPAANAIHWLQRYAI